MDNVERFLNESRIKADAIEGIRKGDNMFVVVFRGQASAVMHGPVNYAMIGAVTCWLQAAIDEMNAEIEEG